MQRRVGLCRVVCGVLVLSAGAWGAVPAVAVDVSFSGELPVGGSFAGAAGLELADLDGDGDLDAVAAAAVDGDVSWWENSAGDGSAWSEHPIDASFAGAASVRVADLDRDGWPDVVAAARTDGDVAWWRNDGTPASGAWTRFSIDISFAGARSVWVADLDRDGTPDVLAAGETVGQIAWWTNDGTPTDDTTDDGAGNFWTQHTVQSGLTAPVAVTAADLDGDGFLDVVGADHDTDALGWWQNDGDPTDGGWTARFVDLAFPDVRALSTADLDGDGDLDVIAASDSAGDTVAWWRNDGDPTDDTNDGMGNFWTQHTVASAFDGADSVRAADLDGDGDLDLLAAAETDDQVAWWENDGNPTNDTTDFGGGNFWADHSLDLAFDGAQSATAGDLDGDGDLDVAAAAFDGGLVSWWRADTIHHSASFIAEASVASPNQPRAVALADLDGDGDLDLVGGHMGSPDALLWWESDGTPGDGGWSEHTAGNPTFAPEVLAAGDLDGDGDPDVVAGYGIFGSDFEWWENDGTPAAGAWAQHLLRAATAGIRAIELADLDRDGDLDVVYSEAFADAVGWFENDGSSCSPACAWPDHSIDSAFANAFSVAIADLDRDGDLDVASQSALDQILVWWENDGTPGNDAGWTEHGIDSGIDAICPVVTADVDGDGDPDVLSCPGTESSLRWFENDGSPDDDTSWVAQAQVIPAPATPYDAVPLDLDGDGDVDLAASIPEEAILDDRFLAWWENAAGDGSTWTRHDVAAPLDETRIAAGDLDGDGKPDLAVAESLEDAVLWWPNGGGQFALAISDVSSSGILDGASDDVFSLAASHRGRTGDSMAELASLDLLFEEAANDPLSTAELNALVDTLAIYVDEGAAGFDGGDTLLASVPTPMLVAGALTVNIATGPDARFDLGAPKTFLVVVTAAADASTKTPHTFRVTLQTAPAFLGRDATSLLPLELETTSDVTTGPITAQAGCFALTLSHTGGGSDPAPTPAQSTGCAAGEYVPGEVVGLEATPDAGWLVAGWTGTGADASTDTTNSVTMPATAHAASVAYEFPDELILDGDFLSGTQVREACLTIRAGDVPAVEPSGATTTVASSADVTLRAGEEVVFYDGFQVRANASLTVEIASPTACPP